MPTSDFREPYFLPPARITGSVRFLGHKLWCSLFIGTQSSLLTLFTARFGPPPNDKNPCNKANGPSTPIVRTVASLFVMNSLTRKLSLSFRKRKTDKYDYFIDPDPVDSGRLKEDSEPKPLSTRSINRIAEENFIDSTALESPQLSDRHIRRRPIQPSRNEPRAAHYSSPTISWVPHNLGNVLPRYGHMVNVAGGKSDEIYLYGGKQYDRITDELHRVNPGIPAQNWRCSQIGTPEVIRLTGGGTVPCALWMGASVLSANKFYCIKAHFQSVIDRTVVFGGQSSSADIVVDRGLHIYTLSLNLVLPQLTEGSRNWSHVKFKGWDQRAPYGHTLNLVGSRLYVFGGIGETIHESRFKPCVLGGLLSFDLLNLDKAAEASWEPILTDQKPAKRSGHTCVTLSDAGPLILCDPPLHKC